MGVTLYCNVNDLGGIIESFSGVNIIPESEHQYQHSFYIEGTSHEQVLRDIPNYKVVGGELKLNNLTITGTN